MSRPTQYLGLRLVQPPRTAFRASKRLGLQNKSGGYAEIFVIRALKVKETDHVSHDTEKLLLFSARDINILQTVVVQFTN